MILSTVACNLDSNILQAALPLFASEKVAAIEWSFDTLYQFKEAPPWFLDLLKAYSDNNRLVGHGVFFSLFSGKWSSAQEDWLKDLKKWSATFQFDHISEHFGFMTGEDFHKGAPLNLPYSATTLAIGRDRLKRIYEVCQCPVGLENLAFAYSLEEVKKHGSFLDDLMAPINGFIILDLHNLFCQIANFNIDFDDILKLYPLHLVREIHVSGGSWEESNIVPTKKIRRDTHDDKVPMEVFGYLEKVIAKCPNLKYVVLEQLGTGLKTTESQLSFQEDFNKLNEIVSRFNENNEINPQNDFQPNCDFKLENPIENQALHLQQVELSKILEEASNYKDAQLRLANSSLAKTDWNVEQWDTYMLETAIRIAQKWKGGFS